MPRFKYEIQTLTWVLWEANSEGGVVDLVLEQVLLVQEKDDGGVDKPLIVADWVEEFHALHHPGG